MVEKCVWNKNREFQMSRIWVDRYGYVMQLFVIINRSRRRRHRLILIFSTTSMQEKYARDAREVCKRSMQEYVRACKRSMQEHARACERFGSWKQHDHTLVESNDRLWKNLKRYRNGEMHCRNSLFNAFPYETWRFAILYWKKPDETIRLSSAWKLLVMPVPVGSIISEYEY